MPKSLLLEDAKINNDEALSKIGLNKLLEYSYLNLEPRDFLETHNELIEKPTLIYENPLYELIDFMRQPDNFAFTCKWLLGVDLIPFQVLILQELWRRKYPMFIAARGAGKCITGDTKIMLSDGIYNISDIIDKDSQINIKQYVNNNAFGENGFQNIEYAWNNGMTNNIRLKTRMGFELEGTKNHPIRVVCDGNIVWKNLEDIKIGDYIPIDRTESWFEKTNDITEDEAYLFGLLVGDGGYTIRGRIGFTNIDKELVDEFYRLSNKLFNYNPIVYKSCKITHYIYGTKIWDDLFQKYGFNSPVCGEKDVPACIFHAKKNVVAKFISGLFDTDGTFSKSGILSFTSKSKNLVKSIQFILTRFGIISKFRPKLNKKYNRYYYDLQITGDNVAIFAEKIGFGLSRKQNKILLFLKNRIYNTNLDIIPHKLVLDDLLEYVKIYKSNNIISNGHGYNYNRQILSSWRIKKYQPSYNTFKKILDITKCHQNTNLYNKLIDIYNQHYYYDKIVSLEEHQDITYDLHIPNDHSFITNGIISHNSYLLALYAVLLLLLKPGSKIIFVGAGFRQSKILFEYVESFFRTSPIFRDIIGPNRNQGPKHDTDRHSFYAGDSVIHALPIGDGQKIRGMRATSIISDEFSCLGKETLIQTDSGLIRIDDIFKYDSNTLLNKDLKMEVPSHFIKTPETEVYKITVAGGYSFKCSSIHQIMTMDGWKLAKDLTTNDVLELDNNDYFPSRYIEKDGVKIDEEIGWLLGLLISEGTVTNRNYITITTTDEELKNKITSKFAFDWKIHVNEAHTDNRGWKCKKSYAIQYSNTKFRETLYELGLDYRTSHKKTIPWCILQSPKSVVLEFLRGLFYGDGSAFNYMRDEKKNIGIAYYSVSERLIDELQILLLKFNITCSKNTRKSAISNNMQPMLSFRAKNAIDLYNLLNLDKWKDLVNEAFFRVKKPFIREKNNRFYASTNRGDRTIHIGSFNNEEECIEAFNKYWSNINPCARVKSIERLDEKEKLYDFYLPETHSFRGNGFIHHNSMVQEIFEVVIEGFASVNINPVDKIKKISSKKILNDMGVDTSNIEETFGNQTIISGTAFYAFNHFYDYWRRYKAIVESRGDMRKLEEIFNGEVPSKFDWRDYSVIRLPYEAIPEGMMDEAHIAKAKALMHSSRYQMEYSACLLPNTDIITDIGCKKIIDIEIGDNVLTHTGQFKRVIKKTFRKYDGNIIKLKCYGYNQEIGITPNHKVWYNDNWTEIENVLDKTNLAKPLSLNDNSEIDITNYCDNYTILSHDNNYISYNNNRFEYKIKSKKYEYYNGFVYNLEVEDDNSYSLPCMTVHNCFPLDSDGFYKRSLIESCVTPVEIPSGKVQFKSSITGSLSKQYVYGIDPASEDDNFTIIVLELHDDHRRIIYGWSATKQKLRERLKKVGKDNSGTSYYSYCARKIRNLMKIFPTDHIVIDKQGGGIPLIEAFHHLPDIEPGEAPLWPYLVRGKDDPFWWEKDEKPTDNESGLHIIHEFQFSDAKLVEESNHSLRKDLETKTLLFPMFDAVELGLSLENDIAEGREYDTLEDCVLEIEELKNELSTITHSRTPSGRDKWSTPEIKEVGGRIGRMRKDRYSALLMANQIARTIGNTIGKIPYHASGGYVGRYKKENGKDGPLYYGPSHVVEKLSKYSGCGVVKKN